LRERRSPHEPLGDEPLERLPERQADLLGPRLYRAVGLIFLFALLYRFFDPIARVTLIAFVCVILGIAFNALVSRMPIRRGFAVVVVALCTLVAIGVATWFGVTLLFDQIRQFAEDMPSLLAGIEEWEAWLEDRTGLDFELIGPHVQTAVNRLLGQVDGAAVLAGAFGMLELVAMSILVLVASFFIVADPDNGLLTPIMRAVPRHKRPAFEDLFRKMGERLSAWLWGTLIAMLIVGALAIMAFYFLGTPYPLLLGVIIGITNIIPLIGPWIGGIVAVIVTLVLNPGLALWVALSILIIQEIEGNLVRPFVFKGVAKVHPFATLLALLLFTSMFGILGAVLSLPLLLAIATIVEVFWVEETIGTAEDDIEPMVED
jgi:predicted PurR-regulated permease PerM